MCVGECMCGSVCVCVCVVCVCGVCVCGMYNCSIVVGNELVVASMDCSSPVTGNFNCAQLNRQAIQR